MTDKIRAYIDHAFADVQETQRVREFKEELFSNLIEKYNEQLMNGKSEAEAYNIVISGIGDLSEVVDSMRIQPLAQQPSPVERSRQAILTTVAIILYILCPVPIIIFANFGNEVFQLIGVVALLAMVAIATGLLIYRNMTRPVYRKNDETIVEDFKEYRVSKNNKSNNASKAMKAFSGAFWMLIVAIYFVTSFVFRIWAFSWIIFIIAAAIQNIFYGILKMKEDDQ